MGSVIHLLRERHGRDCLKETRTSKQENELSFLIKDTMKMLKG